MAKKQGKRRVQARRVYPRELKQEAVQMMLDGHSAQSVADRLGLPGTSLLYKWKRDFLQEGGTLASGLGCTRPRVGGGIAARGARA